MFHWGSLRKENPWGDMYDLIWAFHESLGGVRCYTGQAVAVKYICCGLKNSLILKKSHTVSQLRGHLETMSW